MDIWIREDELLILAEEKAQAENVYGLSRDATSIQLQDNSRVTPRLSGCEQAIIADPSFRVVQVDGQAHSFGDIQSNVLRLLHQASQSGEPWQSGKRLLKDAGSVSFSLPNVFKRRPIWRKLVISDRQGNYRLSSSCILDNRSEQALEQ